MGNLHCSLLITALTSFLHVASHAQYFQQEVDYDIEVTLDPKLHVLSGSWQMTYHNHSPDTLHSIIMHLYPNAYSSRNTAFAKQQLRLGETDFHFADPSELGRIDSLDFRANDQQLLWSLDAQHPDIATVTLTQPLLPGKSIVMKSPMRVKIPKAFSRLGRIGDSYQITQWYPKPSVYDQDGWHPLPYLSMGEFYSEFGSFDVSVTVPAQHIVAATGELQSRDAIYLLDSLASVSNAPAVPASSSSGMRTWKYHADQVHDFAWFADPEFIVRKSSVMIGSRHVDCWAFFREVEQELWEHATEYLAAAVKYYSEQVGDYPYPQMTGVHVPLGKDLGMEYPMITNLNLAGDAKTLDDVLAHEVGHNWFYGILGFNERKHPWMDEGINTFYEFGYLRERYGAWSEHILLIKRTHPEEMSDEQRVMQFLTHTNQLTAPDTDPEYITDLQTFFGAYFKPAVAFDMLSDYMGDEVFRTAMQDFYNTWKFRHPGPEDLELILTEHCACDLGWLFDGLLGSDALIDYKITEWDNGSLTVVNDGNISAPIEVLAYRDSQVVFQEWHNGFTDTKTFFIPAMDIDRIQVYEGIYTLDQTPSNNFIHVDKTSYTHARLKVRILGGKQYPGEKYLNLLPLIGWNRSIGPMAGIAVSNTFWPPGPLQWGVLPMYSFDTKSIVGMGEIRYRQHDEMRPRYFEYALGVKSFHFEQDTHYGFFNRYFKLAPRIGFVFENRKAGYSTHHHLQYRYVYIQQEYGRGIDYEAKVWEQETRHYGVHEMRYSSQRDRTLHATKMTMTAQAGKGFVRIMGDLRHRIAYAKPKKGLYLHAFGGLLPYHQDPKANVNFNLNGIQNSGIFSRDYLYDEFLLERNPKRGLVSQMVFLKDAQVKTLYNGGLSDKWMIAAGLATDIPLPIPIQPYFDVAIYNDPFEVGALVSYSGGLAISVQKDVFEIFIPLIESKDIRESLTYIERDTIFRRISILLDLKAFHPFNYKGF